MSRHIRGFVGFASAGVALLLLAGAAQAIGKVEEQDLIVQCAACHGADGVAKDSEVPHLACQQTRYLYNQLMAFRRGKRIHKEMKYMGRHMTSADMDAIADHYASMPCR